MYTNCLRTFKPSICSPTGYTSTVVLGRIQYGASYRKPGSRRCGIDLVQEPTSHGYIDRDQHTGHEKSRRGAPDIKRIDGFPTASPKPAVEQTATLLAPLFMKNRLSPPRRISYQSGLAFSEL